MRGVFALWVVFACTTTTTTTAIGNAALPTAYVNGRVYGTAAGAADPAEAFVVGGDGRFSQVGRTHEVLAAGKGHAVVDLKGATVVPGLVDSHAHLLGLGLAHQAADLVGATSIAEVRRRLRAYVDANVQAGTFDPRHDWLFGVGWNQNLWGSSFPSASDLDVDPVLARVPIALLRVDAHAAWVNGAVLAAMTTVTELPETVPGGAIVREPYNGQPTGIFVDNAMDLLLLAAPVPSRDKMTDAVLYAIRECNSFGITSVHEAGIGAAVIELYKDLIDEGRFSLRNYAMTSCDERNTFCHVPKVVGYGDGHLTVASVKLYLDGALGSWGAAMLANYTDDPTTQGFLRMDPALLAALVGQWVDAGFQVNAHAIGDRANRIAIDAFEHTIESSRHTGADLRLRLEHAQHLALDDIARIGRLGIIPSMQPTHATSDMGYAEQRLGPDRIQGAYAWRKLLDAGVPALALGSDFPVERVNPFLVRAPA